MGVGSRVYGVGVLVNGVRGIENGGSVRGFTWGAIGVPRGRLPSKPVI